MAAQSSTSVQRGMSVHVESVDVGVMQATHAHALLGQSARFGMDTTGTAGESHRSVRGGRDGRKHGCGRCTLTACSLDEYLGD